MAWSPAGTPAEETPTSKHPSPPPPPVSAESSPGLHELPHQFSSKVFVSSSSQDEQKSRAASSSQGLFVFKAGGETKEQQQQQQPVFSFTAGAGDGMKASPAQQQHSSGNNKKKKPTSARGVRPVKPSPPRTTTSTSPRYTTYIFPKPPPPPTQQQQPAQKVAPTTTTSTAPAAPVFVFGSSTSTSIQQDTAGFVNIMQAGKNSTGTSSAARRTALRKAAATSTPGRKEIPVYTQQPRPPPHQVTISNTGAAGRRNNNIDNPLTNVEVAAEQLRTQGNAAFKEGRYNEAYVLYTKAIQAFAPHPNPGSKIAVIFANRAATCLSLARPYSALTDCQMGLQYDSANARCALRMVTAHVRLGNITNAEYLLEKMKETAVASMPHLLSDIEKKWAEVEEMEKLLLDALCSLGHEVGEEEMGKKATTSRAGSSNKRSLMSPDKLDAAVTELHQKVFPLIPHAEVLYAAHAEALLRLGKFGEASGVAKTKMHEDGDSLNSLWRYWISAQVEYFLGNLDEAALLVTKLQKATVAHFPKNKEAGPGGYADSQLLQQLVPIPGKEQLEEMLAWFDKVQQLKKEGNEAIGAKRYEQAIKKYTEALDSPVSGGFAAVLLSNRAAAHQGLLQWSHAVADCCRAKALIEHYPKVHSRLASVLSELKDYNGAAAELQTALSLPGLDQTMRIGYQQRLSEARRRASSMTPSSLSETTENHRNHYMLLSLEQTCGEAEVRKAYKRLALVFHPDKSVSSCPFARSLDGGSQLIIAHSIEENIRKEAAFVFQLLGTAHEVLTDKKKRWELDDKLHQNEVYGYSRYQQQQFHRYNSAPSYSYSHYGPGPGRQRYRGYTSDAHFYNFH
jgi:tetratricopeptide (TPR) repeat protein